MMTTMLNGDSSLNCHSCKQTNYILAFIVGFTVDIYMTVYHILLHQHRNLLFSVIYKLRLSKLFKHSSINFI